MKAPTTPATPPIPSELAGQIDAAQSLISYLLMQRTGANPDRVIAFTQWEKKVRAELSALQEQAKRTEVPSNLADKPEAAAAAGGRK